MNELFCDRCGRPHETATAMRIRTSDEHARMAARRDLEERNATLRAENATMAARIEQDSDHLSQMAAENSKLRAALETIATIHESHEDCSQVERVQQAYDMRCVARNAILPPEESTDGK